MSISLTLFAVPGFSNLNGRACNSLHPTPGARPELGQDDSIIDTIAPKIKKCGSSADFPLLTSLRYAPISLPERVQVQVCTATRSLAGLAQWYPAVAFMGPNVKRVRACRHTCPGEISSPPPGSKPVERPAGAFAIRSNTTHRGTPASISSSSL